jgi:hypothetical protein
MRLPYLNLKIKKTKANELYLVLCTVPRINRTLNHTDAKALVACRHVRLWHWCGLLIAVINVVSK